jgi:hypothetical protein
MRRAYALIPRAFPEGFSILGRLWIPLVLAIALAILFAYRIHFSVHPAFAASAGDGVTIFLFFFIFAEVMRLRWPQYRLSGGTLAWLVMLAIGVGILGALSALPGYLVAKLLHQSTIGGILEWIGQTLIASRLAFVLFASQGEAFVSSWRMTAGALYWPILAALVITQAFTRGVSLVSNLGTGTAVVILSTAAFVVCFAIVQAVYGAWAIRWMPIAEEAAEIAPYEALAPAG